MFFIFSGRKYNYLSNIERKLFYVDDLVYAGDMWKRTFDRVAKEFSDVKTDYQHVDAASMFFVTNPEKFDGKTIYIKGFLNLSFEGNALYLSDKDFDFKIFKNAIYLWLSNEDSFNLREQCNHKYVSIIGIFKVDKGHFGMFSGSIKNIKRIDIVEKRI